MNINNAFESKHLKASNLPPGQRVRVTIERVEMEVIGQGKDQSNKPVVYFVGKKKGLCLNVTNANMIVEIANSTETEDWTGVRIALYSTKVDYAGKRVDAIRVDYPPPSSSTLGAGKTAERPAAPNLGVEARANPALRDVENGRRQPNAIIAEPISAVEENDEWNTEEPPF